MGVSSGINALEPTRAAGRADKDICAEICARAAGAQRMLRRQSLSRRSGRPGRTIVSPSICTDAALQNRSFL